MEKYKEVIEELLKLQGRSKMWLSKAVGLSRSAVSLTLSDYRPNMRVDTYLKYLTALGATVTVEWRNPGDRREVKKCDKFVDLREIHHVVRGIWEKARCESCLE